AMRTSRRVTSQTDATQPPQHREMLPASTLERMPAVSAVVAPVQDVDEDDSANDPSAAALNPAEDDRDHIQQGDRVLLVVENDLAFARFLLDAARAKGFKGLVTTLGAAALNLVNQYKPSAITLDMYLPDMAGWRVLDRLKHDAAVRH